MSDQERKEQQREVTPPERQQPEHVADLAQPELDREKAEQTKGGIVFGSTQRLEEI